jgi:hypothetical protein
MSYQSKLLQVKPIESYPDFVKNELKIISMKASDLSTPFGSYIYRLQPFAGDLDTLQHIHYKNENATVATFIKRLKNVLRNLDKNHVYSELKAGMDYNYVFKVGDLENGTFLIDNNLIDNLNIRYKQNLFDENEYRTMINAIQQVKNTTDKTIHSMAYDYIFDLVRNKWVLRWTKEDILRSYKILSNGEKYTLAEAIRDETMVKIDLISLVNHKFVEVTNIIFLAYPEINPINIAEEVLHAKGLSGDIERLYYSNKFYSPFKACKRIYAEMRRIKNYEYLNRIAPIIRHEISLLYQIKSELDTFCIVLDKTKGKYYINTIDEQLQSIKGRLNYVLDISQDQIKDFSNDIDNICEVDDRKEKCKMIDELSKSLKMIIEFLTITAMNKQKFNPFPSLFLPAAMSYDKNHIRKPTDNPTKIYKEFVQSLNE